ncbi:MAG TPA: CHAT domain-containing protein [Thermoleophilaceae bacterium]|nr:CHAT domain-containing protein [Thermoleophilaceae bacterium]
MGHTAVGPIHPAGTDPDPDDRLALYAPTRVDRWYLLQWCEERGESVDTISQESLAIVAREIARNLPDAAGRLKRLMAFEGRAWSSVDRVVRAALPDVSELERVAALKEIATQLLGSIAPEDAGRRDHPQPIAPARTPYVLTCALDDWIRFVAIRAEVDRELAGAGRDVDLLRERGDAVLRDLLKAMAELPERQRLALALRMWRPDAPDAIIEKLYELALEVIPDTPLASRADLFPLEPGARLDDDQAIADWMTARYGGGKKVKPDTVRVNRSHARNALGGDATRSHLLSLLLGRAPKPAAPAYGAGSEEADPLLALLESVAGSGSLRLWELLVGERCRGFAPTLPLFAAQRRAGAGEGEHRRAWRDLPQHLDRCVRCHQIFERLVALEVGGEPDRNQGVDALLAQQHEAEPPEGATLPPEVQRALAEILERRDIQAHVKLGLLRSLREQKPLDKSAMMALQARVVDAGEVAKVAEAAWETLADQAPFIGEIAVGGDGRGFALTLRAENSRGSIPVVQLRGAGARGRLTHVGGSLRLALRGLPQRLRERELRLQAVTAAGREIDGFQVEVGGDGAVNAVSGAAPIGPAELRDVREVRLIPTGPASEITLARDLGGRSEEERRRGDLYGALRYAQDALILSQRLGVDDERGRALLAAGRAYTALGYFHAANRVLGEAADLGRSAGDAELLVDAEHALAQLHRAWCRWEDAERHARNGLRLLSDIHGLDVGARRKREAWLLVDLAHVAIARGDPAEGRQHARQALRHFSILDPFGRASAELELAIAERAAGRFEVALAAAERARTLVTLSRETPREERLALEGEIVCLRGKTLHSLGEFHEALACFRKSLELMYEAGSPSGEATALAARARVHEALGNHYRALRTFRRARERFIEIGDPAGAGEVAGSMARLHVTRAAQVDPAERDHLLREAERLTREAVKVRRGDKRGTAIALTELGRVLTAIARESERTGTPAANVRAEAREALERAVRLRRVVQDDRGLAASLSALAAQLDADEARDVYAQALALHERTHDSRGQIRTLTELGRLTEDVSYYYRAIRLIEDLRSNVGPRPEQRANYLATVAHVYHECARLLAPTDAERALTMLEAGRARALLERVSREGIIKFDPTRPSRFDSIRLRRHLAADEVALVFVSGDPFLLFVVTPADVEPYELDMQAATLASEVHELRASVISGDWDAESGRRFVERLLAPAAEALEFCRSACLVLDGALHHLPHAALTGILPGTEGSPLCDADVRTAASLATDAVLSSRPARATETALLTVAPGAADADAVGSAAVEAAAVCQAFKNARRRPLEELGGADVTRDAVSAAVELHQPLDVLHVAADSDQAWSRGAPDRPADLLLARDEMWTADAVWASLLDVEFVALSADNAAIGPDQRGEGELSLARAFIGAGARAVCASTLPVVGDSAAKFFESFYRRMLGGVSLSRAVREAQAMLADEGLDPLHWAGWQLTGVSRKRSGSRPRAAADSRPARSR